GEREEISEEITSEDETADWEIYQDKEIGIEFNYPSSWRVSSTWEEKGYIEINLGFKSEPLPGEPGYTPGPPVISILIEDNPGGLNAEEFYDGDPGNNYFKPPDYYAAFTEPHEVLIIGEKDVYKVCFGATYCGDCIYIVPFKNLFFLLDLCCFCDEFHNEQKLIIQTLKATHDF
ncbi:unnamed protein product, partial [marine sediment metagenome]